MQQIRNPSAPDVDDLGTIKVKIIQALLIIVLFFIT
jgi:hypothetical protein